MARSGPPTWAVAGELRKRLLAAMAANGIEIPAPVLPSGMPVSGSVAAALGSRPERPVADDDPPEAGLPPDA